MSKMSKIETIILFIGFLLWVGVFVGGVRSFFAGLVNPVLSPLLSMNVYIAIFVPTAIVVCASVIIAKHYVDFGLRKRVGDRMREIQKEIKTAKDLKKIEELQEKQLDLMKDQLIVAAQNLKMICAIAFFSTPLCSWISIYVIKGLIWVAGWIILSITIGVIFKTIVDRLWRNQFIA